MLFPKLPDRWKGSLGIGGYQYNELVLYWFRTSSNRVFSRNLLRKYYSVVNAWIISTYHVTCFGY